MESQAEEGYRSGLTSELTFAVTVWALLLATLVSPLAFRRCIPDGNEKDHAASESLSKGTQLSDRERSQAAAAKCMRQQRAQGSLDTAL